MLDLENFDISSHEESIGLQSSLDYGETTDKLFKSNKMMPMNINKAERYSTISAQKSEGEVGATEDDISLGEIRVPGPGSLTVATGKRGGMPAINISAQLRNPATINNPRSRPILAETINYEEDKEISPEKDDEKPIYESTEGPI
jgi:hypothetical protein